MIIKQIKRSCKTGRRRRINDFGHELPTDVRKIYPADAYGSYTSIRWTVEFVTASDRELAPSPRPAEEDKIHVGVYIYTYTCACAYIYTYKWNISILCSRFGFNPSATSLFVHFYLISRPLLPFSSCATSHSVLCYPFHSLPPHSLSFSAFLSIFCHLTFRLLCYRLLLLTFVFCHPLFFLSYLIFRPLPPPISSSATLSRPKLPIFSSSAAPLFVLYCLLFRPLLPPSSSTAADTLRWLML